MADLTREYRNRVVGDGRVFHEGSEVVDPPALRFFLRAMRRAGDYREPLDAATLQVGDGRLAGRVRGGAFPARFGRVAMQQLAPFLVDGGAGPALLLDGRRRPAPAATGAAA